MKRLRWCSLHSSTWSSNAGFGLVPDDWIETTRHGWLTSRSSQEAIHPYRAPADPGAGKDHFYPNPYCFSRLWSRGCFLLCVEQVVEDPVHDVGLLGNIPSAFMDSLVLIRGEFLQRDFRRPRHIPFTPSSVSCQSGEIIQEWTFFCIKTSKTTLSHPIHQTFR